MGIKPGESSIIYVKKETLRRTALSSTWNATKRSSRNRTEESIGIGVVTLVRRGQVEEYEGDEEIEKTWPWKGKERL